MKIHVRLLNGAACNLNVYTRKFAFRRKITCSCAKKFYFKMWSYGIRALLLDIMKRFNYANERYIKNERYEFSSKGFFSLNVLKFIVDLQQNDSTLEKMKLFNLFYVRLCSSFLCRKKNSKCSKILHFEYCKMWNVNTHLCKWYSQYFSRVVPLLNQWK